MTTSLRRALIAAALAAVLFALVLAGAAVVRDDPEPNPGPPGSAKGDGTASPPGPAAAADPALAGELHRLGAEGSGEDHSSPAAPPGALAAARRFLTAYLAYEVGAGGQAIRRRLRRASTDSFAAQLLAVPPRLPPGVDARPRRAALIALEVSPAADGANVTIVARLRRGDSFEAAAFELVRRQQGWVIAGVSG